jgi:polysaccharide export outer membrane protein
MSQTHQSRGGLLGILLLVWAAAPPVLSAEPSSSKRLIPRPAAQVLTGAEAQPLYHVGLGDRLDVFFLEENTHTECLVRPDGRITLPLVGDVDAEGQTPPELAARIRKAMEPFAKEPTVTVTVREINSYRVYVLGNVRNQMMVQSTTPLRVLQALAIAGGLNEFADKNLVVIRERKSGPPLRIAVNYNRIIKGEQPDMDVRLEAGDVLVAQ